ncbi:MAG: M20 family dipeptidase [Chloroflexi bacterium]|nr:M20 family dipeptidase [Chloroflexota bacterium]
MRPDDITSALEHCRRTRASALDGFKTLLRFPSISQDNAFQPPLLACADWILAETRRIGLDNVQALPTAGNPILYADWLHAGVDKPTILFYAHYDVQPAGDESLWETPPFAPTHVDGRLVARGAVDDKCGVWFSLVALDSILSACGALPVNVKLFFEGEEELGSKNAGPCIAANRELLAADALIIADGPFSAEQPIIGYAVRGSVTGEVRIQGPPHDLHSGRYGGAVSNPAHCLARVIASLHDGGGRVRIRGFYDDATPMTDRQTQHMNLLWKTIGAEIQRAAGVEAFFGDALGVFAERTTAQPTLDVSRIRGGGAGAIIPAEASFKLTIRTVAGQDADTMWSRFVEHVMAFAESGLRIEAELLSIAHPFLMADDSREIQAIQRALHATLGKQALLMRHGGSLAIGGLLAKELNMPATMFGLGSGGNSHAPNEYIVLEDIQLATEVAIRLLFELGNQEL